MYETICYFLLNGANFSLGNSLYKLSKPEKIGLASAIFLGIDSITIPALTGETLHSKIGLSPSETVETIIKSTEIGGAFLGMFYHTTKNNIYLKKERKKEKKSISRT